MANKIENKNIKKKTNKNYSTLKYKENVQKETNVIKEQNIVKQDDIEIPKKKILEIDDFKNVGEIVLEVEDIKPKQKKKPIKKIVFSLIFIFFFTLIAFGLGLYFKFQNIYVELGSEKVDNTLFARYGSKSNYDVNLENIDLNKVGEYHVTIKYLGISFSKKVYVEDKTPPVLEVQEVNAKVDYQFKLEDFIVKNDDLSETKLDYITDFTPSEYGEYKVSITSKDIYGNSTTKDTKLIISWVKLSYELEVGDILKNTDLVYNTVDSKTVSEDDIKKVNNGKPGNYEVVAVKEKQKLIIQITKNEDKTPPTLNVKNLKIYEGKKIDSINNFVTKVYDKGGKVSLRYLTEIDYKKIGSQKIKIEAKDENNNITEKEATLTIMKDNKGPVIKGLSKLTVNKNTKINYQKGVSAYDDNFGKSDFSVDTSKVDVTKYGTYYAIYTSSDKLGNKTTSKRIIIVNHDKSDTNELVKKVAGTLSSNPESIRDYVRSKIKYNSNSGGKDPVWYGLTEKVGNCIVHAYTFDAILKVKGYNTKIIWTTDKTHYWNMVYLNGKWVHMDSTPGSKHNKYSIMNDAQRYERLQGRDWDRSLWPKAE